MELNKRFEIIGNAFVNGFHILSLFIIGAAVVWSTILEYLSIFDKGTVSLKDILLLFIYLELIAMVGIYFKTKKLPVIFLIYIAITALTRVLSVDIKEMESEKILALSGAILLLAVSGLLLSGKTGRLLARFDRNPETE